jgi:hypothetical protein
MSNYIFRRLLLMIPLLLGITLITFGVMHLAPGNPSQSISDMNVKVSSEAKARLTELYGLDKPWYVQYVRWLKRFALLDFGNSFRDGRPAIAKIAERLPATLLLNILSLLLILIAALPIGIYSAVHKGSLFDRGMTVFVFLGFSVPAFWLALLLMIQFGLKFGVLPISGLHALNYALFVLALNNQRQDEALAYVWNQREKLSPQGLAMLARTVWRAGRREDAQVALRNLENFAVHEPANDTLRFGAIEGCWYWWQDAVEASSQGLMAYLEIAPKDEAVTRLMKWLVLNRRGNRWKSTKDTAQAVLALSSYMRQAKESVQDMTIDVAVGSLPVKSFTVDADNFWKFDGKVVFEGDALPDGRFPVVLTKRGGGTLFYSVYAEYFTQEEGIKKAGNEIYVERSYEKLVRKAANGKKGVVAADSYVGLKEGDQVNSGDELRVTLRIKSLNDYEYLVFEDPKPAGMEPVALQSGTSYGDGLCSNMELRDAYVAFFITHLEQGEHQIRYNCRAEIPGTFHTMVTKGYAMYVPELRANSDELVVKVVDVQK